jgi:hypothetical protein
MFIDYTLLLGLAVAFGASTPTKLHPHVPKVLKVGLSDGQATLRYFTVPFNSKHLENLQPGFNWHAGFASLQTERALELGDQTLAPGNYKFNFVKQKNGWAAEFVAMEIATLRGQIQRAKRGGNPEQVQELEDKLGLLLKDQPPVLAPFTMFQAGDEEHLRMVVMHEGFTAKTRTDPTPVSGAAFTLQMDFGNLHGRLAMVEKFEAKAGDEGEPSATPRRRR